MALNQRRMISSQIWEDERFYILKANEKLLYIGMITLGDDQGRFKADPQYLSLKIFPFTKSISTQKVKLMTEVLTESSLIVTYQTEKCLVGYHPNWTNHQQIRGDRSKPSLFPPLPTTNCQPDDNQVTAQVKLSKENISKDKKREYKGREKIIKNIPENSLLRKQLEKETDNEEISLEDIPF